MFRMSIGGPELTESVRNWTSGSLVRSFLGVREMCFVLDRKVATRGLSCDDGRMEVNPP